MLTLYLLVTPRQAFERTKTLHSCPAPLIYANSNAVGGKKMSILVEKKVSILVLVFMTHKPVHKYSHYLQSKPTSRALIQKRELLHDKSS